MNNNYKKELKYIYDLDNENCFNRKLIQRLIKKHENKNKKFKPKNTNRKIKRIDNSRIDRKRNNKTSKNVQEKGQKRTK